MKVGDLVKLKSKYAEWDYGIGILLEDTKALCRVLLDGKVLLFHRHELEAVDAGR